MNARRKMVRWLGIELDEVSSVEKAVSAVGGVVAILVVVVVARWAVPGAAPAVVASMGASAVLLFAVPHGQLSQPWPVLVGHVGSAVIGVTCALVLGPSALAAALAVGLSIGAMHVCKSIHPPGGATALTAVIGGPAVTGLGYRFVAVPVALNAVLVVAVAVAFNALFPWRRYPAAAMPRPDGPSTEEELERHRAVVAALRELDSFIDITEDDLVRLHQLISALELDP